MPFSIPVPRINNNDDFVRVTHLYVAAGSRVRSGDPLADLETDKATFTVEAEREGYLLRFHAEPGESVAVGSILAWMGDTAGEAVPAGDGAASTTNRPEAPSSSVPTLKAALLLARYGLTAADIPAGKERLTAEDVERHLAAMPARRPGVASNARDPDAAPSEPAQRTPLRGPERGMLNTVLWQKEAVPAYLEISYDPRPWAEYAAGFQRLNRLLMSPLLALFVFRLTRLAVQRPGINATVVGADKYVYDHVNAGFTVQSGDNLYAVVIRGAEAMDELTLVRKLGDLQLGAMRGTLPAADLSGATLGFSSLARWPVTRHVPVLLPRTALMVAHCAPEGDRATLGVTYDHRLLHGAEAFAALQKLAQPPGKD